MQKDGGQSFIISFAKNEKKSVCLNFGCHRNFHKKKYLKETLTHDYVDGMLKNSLVLIS